MSTQQEDKFSQRLKTLLTPFTTGKVVGGSGLAIMCALSLLVFLPGGQPTAALALLELLKGLGLNILAGVVYKLYEEVWKLPDKSEQERFQLLTQAIEQHLSNNPDFRKEVGDFLKTEDAARIANEIAKGDNATHGWLLTAIRNDITKYGLELNRLHEERKEQTTLVKELIAELKIGVIYSDDDFREFVPLVENTAESCFGRNCVVININSDIARVRNPSKIIKNEIRDCDVVVFIYSLYSYDPLAPVHFEAASDYFKKFFFFTADTDFSSLINLEPKNEEVTRQEEFLRCVKKHFDTVFSFTDKEDFQSKLGDQFVKINDVPWYGLSHTIIGQRWAEWAEAQMDEICAKKLDSRLILETPLWSFWEEFCSYNWLKEVQIAINNLQLAAQPLEKRKGTSLNAITLQTIPENLFSKNWNEIPVQLFKWCTTQKNKEIEKAIEGLIKKRKSRKKQTKTNSSQLQTELRMWKEAFQTLRSLINPPKVGRCFLVIGRSGAGKTHFVAELLNKQGSSNQSVEYRCIYLEDVFIRSEKPYTEWEIDFENLLLQKAQLKLDCKQEIIQWKSLNVLDDFLCNQRSEQTRPAKLAIIIDEFSEWIKTAPRTFLGNLKQFIEKHTHLRSLVWVFVIKETDYLYVSSEATFFSRYVMPDLPTEVSLQGWLDLDKLNAIGFSRRDKIWQKSSEKYLPLKRIFKHEGLEAEQILVNILQNPNGISMRLLEIPLISWLAADWLNQPDSKMLTALPNLRYIDFIERFSSNRRNKILESGKLKTDEGVSLEEEFEGVFKFLTEQLLMGVDEHKVQKLSADITQNFKDADLNLDDSHIIKRLIDLLTEYRLLEGKKTVRKLDSILIWEYNAAKEIKTHLWLPIRNRRRADDLPEVLPALFGKSGRIRNYLGVFEFFLLLIEKDFSLDNLYDSDRKAIQEIITFAFSDTPNLRSRLWAAIPKTSGSFQHDFIDWLKDQDNPLQFNNKEDFFDYINFLRYAVPTNSTSPNSGVSWDLRIKLLSDNFEYLKKWDLGSYFAKYILNPLCDSIFDGERIALSMAYLHGIENYYSTPPEIIAEMTEIPYIDEYPFDRNEWMRIGEWSFEAIHMLLGSSNPCDQLYQWSKTMVDVVLDKGANRSANIKERDRIWACCARYMLRFIVHEKKEHVLSWLANREWPVWKEYSSEFQEDIFSALEEYLTLEIGKLWRISGKGDQEKYLAMLWDFAKSPNPLRQKTVFYSIQHTVPSPRHYKGDGSSSITGPYPMIDKKLWSILKFLKEHSSSNTEGLFESTFYQDQQEHFNEQADQSEDWRSD